MGAKSTSRSLGVAPSAPATKRSKRGVYSTPSPGGGSPTDSSAGIPAAPALCEAFIVGGGTTYDQSCLLQDYAHSQQLGELLGAFSPALASSVSPQLHAHGGFLLGAHHAASPAWSASSGGDSGGAAGAPLGSAESTACSPMNGWLAAGGCSGALSHEFMFPALATGSLSSFSASQPPQVDAFSAAQGSTNSAATAACDAAVLDGWLQQFVNAEAIESAGDRHPRALSMDAATAASEHLPLPHVPAVSAGGGGFLFGDNMEPELAVAAMPAAVAAIASAAADALAPDVLASMISTAASYCTPRVSSASSPSALMLPATASELSMLAALPFAGLGSIAASPMTNIAPQKTLAKSTAAMGSHETKAATPVPPAKRQRRPAALARRVPSVQAASDATASAAGENGRKFSATRNPGSSKGTPATAATVPASATGRSSTASAAASSAKGAEGAAAVHRQLAPRQTSPPGDAVSKQDLEASAASATQSSRSGSNTPPGLSVLAKIAQKQAPIQVKLEELAPQQQQLRPIAQATSPNHRAQQNPRALAQGAPPPRQPPLCASSHQQPQPVLLPPAGAGETVAQKRQERLIKNRAAALLSRKRKREYMGKLESEIEDLRDSNTSLAQRLADMEARLSALAAERDELRRENASVRAASSLAAGASSASSSGSTTAAGSEGTKADGGKEPAAAEPAPPTAEKPGDAAGDRGGEKRRMADGPAKGGKQRAAGALLMAVLFSFSLFTLPSLYTPDSQIAAGGVQSGGMLPPVRALPPSAAERRLLIGDAAGGPHGLSEHAVAGSPLLERVRRSISELAQQVDGAQAPGNASDDAVLPRARPMSMEQSAGLHAWIKHGLAAAQAQAADSARECAPEQPLSSLSVVHSMPPHGRGSHRDYAMLYCPSMQHVLLGAGLERHHVAASEPAYQPSAPRVIHADAVPDNPPAASSSADDVDDGLPASGLLPPPPSPKPMDAGSADLLVPTQAAAFHHSLLAQRPKMSLYSPVVARGSGLDVSEHADILAPWEEYASSDSSTGRSSIGARQKYLRIDVEVVGSRWVTADKFASGLY